MSLFGGGNVSGIESQLGGLVPQFEQFAQGASALEPNFLNLASQIDTQVPGFLANADSFTRQVPIFEDIANQFGGVASNFKNMATNFGNESSQIYGPGFSQYSAGAAGQVTPDQQAAIDQTLKQMDLSTQGTYANLGLGGSTMETQDTNANKLSSLAQRSQFSALDEQLGLQGLSSALGYGQAGTTAESGATTAIGGENTAQLGANASLTGADQARTGAVNTLNTEDAALSGALSTQTGAGNILSGATGALQGAGSLAAGQQAQQLQALSSLGSALGGKLGGG